MLVRRCRICEVPLSVRRGRPRLLCENCERTRSHRTLERPERFSGPKVAQSVSEPAGGSADHAAHRSSDSPGDFDPCQPRTNR